jgi:SAM-dependent methyltransferase
VKATLENIARKMYYRLPVNLRFTVRRLLFLPLDLFSNQTYNGIKIPPKGLIFTGQSNFIRDGEYFVELLKKHARLRENHSVLDIGSGMGRLAIPLTAYLKKDGSYEGFDVVKKATDWCSSTIQNKFPNFHFKHVPLHNDLYVKTGEKAAQFKFPYTNNQFDVMAAFSVFTHMLPDEIENYLIESARCLKPGGRVFFTFFYLDSEIKNDNSETDFQFRHHFESYSLMDEKVKSANVALQKNILEDMFKKAGLNKIELIPGFWRFGQKEYSHHFFQDIAVFEKPC